MLRRSARAIAAVTVAVLLAAGCSSSGSGAKATSTTSTTAPTSTSAPASPAPYAKTGPYAVGYTTLHLAGGRRVVVWYPAQPGGSASHAQETIDLGGMLSPALQKLIPPADRVLYKANAFAGFPPVAKRGGYPLVIFSHGFAGYPEQSVTLTTHLASWGFVVAAPDHVERSLDGLLGTAAKGVPKTSDLMVLEDTLTLVVNASNASGLLHGLVNPDQIVTAGHSAGAGAAYQFASADPRVKAWISYAVGFGGKLGRAPVAPTKPGMVMLGTTDGIASPARSLAVYAGMHSPKYLVKITGAGHLVFSDICLIGRSKGGVIGIAKAIHLPVSPSLFKLGSDGCNPPHPPVEKAFPAIDQLSVAFFRSALGIDPKPVGLDTHAVAGLGATVTVHHG